MSARITVVETDLFKVDNVAGLGGFLYYKTRRHDYPCAYDPRDAYLPIAQLVRVGEGPIAPNYQWRFVNNGVLRLENDAYKLEALRLMQVGTDYQYTLLCDNL